MLANLTPCEMFLGLSCEGIRTRRDGKDLLFFGRFEKLTAADKAVLRESKAALLLYFDADGELDYCPDGWPRVWAGPIVIGADGGIGPPPANV